MALDFAILGPLEVRDGERAIQISGAKRRQALAILILRAGEVVSSEALIDALWGEDPPETAHKALQMHVVELRRLLGPDVIVTRPRGYLLRADPSQLDLARFEQMVDDARGAASPREKLRRLEAALALWRGAALADVEVPDTARGEVARLAELRLRANEDRIDARLATGDHAGAVAELETLVAEHPLREHLRTRLMLALYRTGRQADALAVFRDTRALLVDELGIEPGRELRELENRILAQDPSLEALPAAELAPVENLVGRERELERLVPILDGALAGRGAVVLLAGEAGIGKSRLAEALARLADTRGARVLVGRCWETGGAPAYWPWVQVLRGYIRMAGIGAIPASAEFTAILPELAGPRPVTDTTSEASRFRLFAAIAALLREAGSERPVAVFLDDLHVADPPSVLLLRFMAAELAQAPVLIVAAYRDDEVDATLGATLADLSREASVHRVALGGLDQAATALLLELTTGVAPDPALVAQVYARTDGNPLFGVEIGRLLAADGGQSDEPVPIPGGIMETILRRLEPRSARCRDVLTLASVLGREFAIDALAGVTELPEDGLLDILDEAESARLIGGVPGAAGRLRFSHMMVRDVLYRALSASRRLRLHRQVAEALEQLYARDLEPHLTEVAHHFLLAGPGVAAKAADYAARAGAQAATQQAYEDAAQHYGNALDVVHATGAADGGRVCELLLARGEALSRAGDEQAAKRVLREAAGRADQAGRPDLLGRAAVGYGGRIAWMRASSDPVLAPLLERALAAIGDEPSPTRVELLARLAAAYRDEVSHERSAMYADEALRTARALGDPRALVTAYEGWFHVVESPERVDESAAVADEVVALAESLDDKERAYSVHDYVLYMRWNFADRAGIDVQIDRLGRLAAQLRQPVQRWDFGTAQTLVALVEGRLEDAERLIAETFSVGRIAVCWNAEVSRRVALFVLRRYQGRLAELEDTIVRSVREYPALPRFACALAHLYAEIGRADAARAVVDELLTRDLAHEHVDAEWMFSMCVLADACAVAGSDAAATIYALLAPYEQRYAQAPAEAPFGSVARALGVLAHAVGRHDDAVCHFETAIEIERRMRARPWLAHAQHGLAEALLARGAPGDADRAGTLRADAREAYAVLGMERWAQRLGEPLATA
jgi:DNA-binding SARP family transcriptional activator/tetratricopeptide (TPR) repeat protein